MNTQSIQADTLDDLLKRVFEKILKYGVKVSSSRGTNKELSPFLLHLTNPLARLSHTEKKGTVYSALGELAWYLSGRDDCGFIKEYISRYELDMEADGTINGAYGPRLFSYHGIDQLNNVVNLIEAKPSTRRAAIQLFSANDLSKPFKDVPCTCSVQFLVRSDLLNMSVSMRSNDAYLGLPHDVFAFTMLQEIVARRLGYSLGSYSHYAASLHIYDEHFASAKQFIREGWQDHENAAMPSMPDGDPWPSIHRWLSAEESLRTGKRLLKSQIKNLDPYWHDLTRLIQVHFLAKKKDYPAIAAIKKEMSNRVYREYIAKRAKPKYTIPSSGQRELPFKQVNI